MLIVGDNTLHLDNTEDSSTGNFQHLLAVYTTYISTSQSHHTTTVTYWTSSSHTMSKRSSPSLSTHRRCPTIHRSSRRLQLASLTAMSVFVRRVCRCWRLLDVGSFRRDLQQSTLVVDPPSNIDKFFACYNDVLRLLLDKHAPLKSVVVRRRSQSPWFDGDCRAMKRKTCRLERITEERGLLY